MGTIFKYRCPRCKYVAEVSGKADFGFFAKTTTISCSICQKLYDVAVEVGEDKDGLDVTKWKTVEPHCPQNKEHSWSNWKHPGACPKCGSVMKEKGGVLMWD